MSAFHPYEAYVREAFLPSLFALSFSPLLLHKVNAVLHAHKLQFKNNSCEKKQDKKTYLKGQKNSPVRPRQNSSLVASAVATVPFPHSPLHCLTFILGGTLYEFPAPLLLFPVSTFYPAFSLSISAAVFLQQRRLLRCLPLRPSLLPWPGFRKQGRGGGRGQVCKGKGRRGGGHRGTRRNVRRREAAREVTRSFTWREKHIRGNPRRRWKKNCLGVTEVTFATELGQQHRA